MIRLIVILLLLLPAGVFGQAPQFVGPLKGLVDAGAGGTAVPDAADIFARGLTFTAPETYTVGATGDFATLEEALTYSRAFTAVYSGVISPLTVVDGFATFNFEIQNGSYTWPGNWRVNGIHLLLYAQNAGQVTITHQCSAFNPALTVDGGGHVILKDLILDGSACAITTYRVDNGKLSLLESQLAGATSGSIPNEDLGIAVVGSGLAYLRSSSVSAATGIYMEEFGQVRIEQTTGADTISGTQAAIRAVERANLSAELVGGTLTLSGGVDGVVTSEDAALSFEAAGGTLEFTGAGGGVAVSDSSRVWIPSATQFNQTGPNTNVTLNLVTAGGAFVSTGVVRWGSGNVFEGATPTNYTAATNDVAAHLAGIDIALGSLGGTTPSIDGGAPDSTYSLNIDGGAP